ncbi:MAG: alpha/beta fold hydrolase [Planctomycetes bacterium]|nr:alpha/beta fold hydrolase [Planctomycetota bacterium]
MDVALQGPAGRLQAKLWEPEGGRAPRAVAVVCHPHPLHGGTMDNKVVFRTARGLQHAGLAVLRFDFRGVRRSEGAHDGQGGEARDLGAALDWMEERYPGAELWAGGFSFGSRTAVQRALVDPRIRRLVLVALPVRAFDCSALRDVRVPTLVVMGERDTYGTLPELRHQFPELPPGIETLEIPGAGHFFDDQTQELQETVRAWAARVLDERGATTR